MYVAKFKIEGTSPISFCKAMASKKPKKKSDGEWEDEIWSQRAHVTDDGQLFIPAMALKKALDAAAEYLSEKIAGKGNSTYSKRFRAGTAILDDMLLVTPQTNEAAKLCDCLKETLFVPSNGQKGGGKRVIKHFPTLKQWYVEATIHVFDEIINPELLREYLSHAGMFIGLLRWRPINGGLYGRFRILDFTHDRKETA